MRWLTIWAFQMTLFMVSSAPSAQDDSIEQRHSPDELMDDEQPGSGNERTLFHKHKQNMEAIQKAKELAFSHLPFEEEHHDRYIGYCKDAYILMWPEHKRKFWSYGYVYLKEDYLANCKMKYSYNTRNYAKDPFCKFGFKVTGSFEGRPNNTGDCKDTDYVFLNDTDGNEAYFCGENAAIKWTSAQDSFEFHFVTKENTPRAKGFFVIIQSFKLCGGSYSIEHDGPAGNLLTPDFPKNYPGNVACSWYFNVPNDEGHEISVKIGCSTFMLQGPASNGTCLYDYITAIYETPNADTPTLHCSNTLDNYNHIIYGTHNNFMMTLRTDETINFKGFNCTYEYILYGE